ncbi:hypothetical protein [Gymnodinialimonas ulvae]|uniref:hypothetical protein n=1 Tax=Gymnodinialimonas ulvae TaxID=3126504 RepID=UPI003094C10D
MLKHFCFFLLIAFLPTTLAARDFPASDTQVRDTIVKPLQAQELTLSYLEALLVELQTLGQVEDDASVDTVDWSSFGITIDIDTLKQREPVAVPKRLMRQHNVADAPIAACDSTDQRCLFGMIARFRLNINTAMAIRPQDLCQQILEDFTSAINTACSPGVTTSSALAVWETDKGDTSFHVLVEQEENRPPILRVSLIGRPDILQGQNGDHFERHDFLVSFAFYETAEYWITVTPIFAMHDLSSSAMADLMAIDRNHYSLIAYSRNTRVIPRRLGDRVRTQVAQAAHSIINAATTN